MLAGAGDRDERVWTIGQGRPGGAVASHP